MKRKALNEFPKRDWPAFRIVFTGGAMIAVLIAGSNRAEAGSLTLTPEGVAAGFTLSTFATLDPGNTGCCNGPWGLAVTSNGNVMVLNAGNDVRYVFPDVDGQTPASAVASVPGIPPSPGNNLSYDALSGYARAGQQIYGTDRALHFVQFNNDGTINHILTGLITFPYGGMAGNPVNGHFLAAVPAPYDPIFSRGIFGNIVDIDPLANGGLGSLNVVVGHTPSGPQAVAVSPDGTVVYFSAADGIEGWNISSSQLIFTSGISILNSAGLGFATGFGVIGGNNALSGDLIVNFSGPSQDGGPYTNGGVALFDFSHNSLTVIATGGTEGGYVAPDPSNGTLLLDYADRIYRLACGANCSYFGEQAIPSCQLTNVINGPPRQLDITMQDRVSGLANIQVVNSSNATIDIPSFSPGSTAPVVVTATKVDPSQDSEVAFNVTNVAGAVTSCDPVDFTATIENRTETHVFRSLAGAEHYIRIVNGAPGLSAMTFQVNGIRFPELIIPNGQTRVLDIGSAMHAGSDNQVLLEAIGRRGSSAYILVGDASIE